jgi:hypothetical protein
MGAASVVGLTGRSRKSTPTRGHRRRVDRQRLHHRLCARIEQIVGLPDQHLQKHRRHRRRRMTRPKRPQAGGTQLLPLRRRQVAK